MIPLTIAILTGLFAVQRHGTARVGRVFGPIMVLWFGTLAVLGVIQIAANPAVLQALEPGYAFRFAMDHPLAAFTVLAPVFLAVTGGEALYADVGHFGVQPVRVAWIWIVMPALVLNYFGQGALVLAHPKAVENPFFLLAPEWLRLPLVVLAAAATVIASQAVITGAFSMTAQAIKLGYLPRMPMLFTSKTSAGQIYIAWSTGCCSPASSRWCSVSARPRSSPRPTASRWQGRWSSPRWPPSSSRAIAGTGRAAWRSPCSCRCWCSTCCSSRQTR